MQLSYMKFSFRAVEGKPWYLGSRPRRESLGQDLHNECLHHTIEGYYDSFRFRLAVRLRGLLKRQRGRNGPRLLPTRLLGLKEKTIPQNCGLKWQPGEPLQYMWRASTGRSSTRCRRRRSFRSSALGSTARSGHTVLWGTAPPAPEAWSWLVTKALIGALRVPAVLEKLYSEAMSLSAAGHRRSTYVKRSKDTSRRNCKATLPKGSTSHRRYRISLIPRVADLGASVSEQGLDPPPGSSLVSEQFCPHTCEIHVAASRRPCRHRANMSSIACRLKAHCHSNRLAGTKAV